MELPQLILIKGLNIDITQYRNMCINVYIYIYIIYIYVLNRRIKKNGTTKLASFRASSSSATRFGSFFEKIVSMTAETGRSPWPVREVTKLDGLLGWFLVRVNGTFPGRIHGTKRYIYLLLVDFYGKNVGEYTMADHMG